MRIAVVTDDGKSVSRHFGMATQYLVVTVDGGQIIGREMRPKIVRERSANEPHPGESRGPRHGTGPGAQARHDEMIETIRDCDALICGGMGYGAYERLKQRGIRPIVSDISDVDQAVIECAEGRIVDHIERLH